MRAILSALLGLTPAMMAFVLSYTPASAIEIQAATPAVSSPIVRISARCRRWGHRCRDLYPKGGWRYRRCMALHGCSG